MNRRFFIGTFFRLTSQSLQLSHSTHSFSNSFSLLHPRFLSVFKRPDNLNSLIPLQSCTFSILSPSMAGHSKWQNIRHTKAAKDLQKSKTATKIAHEIRLAIKSGGGPDPVLNRTLARVMASGKKNNIPNSTMEGILKKEQKSNDKAVTQMFEARAPGNCYLIVEMFTEQPKRVKQKIESLFRKTGGQVLNLGATNHIFHQKGVILIPITDENSLSFEAAEELAINAGAEEVLKHREEEQDFYKFLSDPKQLHEVKSEIEKLGVHVESADLQPVPYEFCEVPEQSQLALDTLFTKLEELDELVCIYDNIKV